MFWRGVCGLCAFALCLALFGTPSTANASNADAISDKLSFGLLIGSDSTPVVLENVILTSSAEVVGSATHLQALFTTPDLEFPFDYRVGVTFPDAFGFDSDISASFSDDSPAPDPEIQNVEIIDHTVIFTFRRTFFAPKSGQIGIIDISGVTLPTVVGGYAATVFISDIDFVILAGPTFSNEIVLTPDVATSIALSPSVNILASAGDLLTFSGNSVDQYGNDIADSTLNWSLTDDSDSLGVVTPGNLLATKTGSGRIVVSSATAADTSGLITVEAGKLARLQLEIDHEQFVGGGICGAGVVRAFDQFDNPRAKFNRADTLALLSVLDGAVIPNVIPVRAFNSDGVLDLAVAGVRFAGFIGETELAVSIGGSITDTVAVSIGGINLVTLDGMPFPTELPTNSAVQTRFTLRTLGSRAIIVDSLRARLTGADIVTISAALSPGDTVQLPPFQTASSPDTISITMFGSAQDESGLESCSTEFTVSVPFDVVDSHIVATPKVDTLLSRAMYSFYRGFGFTSPLPVRQLVRVTVKARNISGDALLIATATDQDYELAPKDELLYFINERKIPDALSPGAHEIEIEATITDGFFLYDDKVSAPAQLLVLSPAVFVATPADLTPRTASPLDSVEFCLKVSTDGLFEDSVKFDRIALQLYDGAKRLRAFAGFNSALDTLRVAPLFISADQAGTSWGARFIMQIREYDSFRLDTLDLGPDVFRVGPLSQISIVNFSSDASNFPFVSAGQQLNLIAQLVNNAPFEVAGVQVAVDTAVIDVGSLAANDTVDVAIPFVAGQPAQFQTVTALVTSANGSRDESTAQIQFTVQSPALLALKGTLNLEDGPAGQEVAEIGSALALQLHMENEGEAETSDGSVLVTATGAGLDFSAIVDLSALITTVNLGVPSQAGTITVTASVLDKPQELNSATDAAFSQAGGAAFEASVLVVERELVVNANIIPGDSTAVAFGERRELFSVELSNVSELESADIRAVTFAVLLRGADGARINPSEVIDVDRSALFDSRGKAVAVLRVANDSLLIDLTPNSLPVGENVTYRFVAQFASRSNVRTFTLSVPLDAIALKALTGPREGALFFAQAPAGAPPFQSGEYTLTAATFVASFQPRNNPFNPGDGSTEYSYTLSADSDIELAIYTLIGKLVRRYNYGAGSQFATAGVQTPSWDGRNGDGAVVRDGVYVVVLTNLSTGEKAYLKQAVLK